jgi:hypothetical protein
MADYQISLRDLIRAVSDELIASRQERWQMPAQRSLKWEN